MQIGGQGPLAYVSAGLVGGGVDASAPQLAAAPAGPAATPRMRELLAGAAPANAAEQLWLDNVGQALQSYITLTQSIVAESQRQAALGRDVFGQPLQRQEDHAWEQRVLELVNAERAKAGLGQLGYSRQLDAAAESHNTYQQATGVMAHAGIGDADPGARIRATGFAQAWGENVATGQQSPEQVVAEWMASPGHRRNILDPNFRQLGVAFGTGANGRTYWAQEFGA